MIIICLAIIIFLIALIGFKIISILENIHDELALSNELAFGVEDDYLSEE